MVREDITRDGNDEMRPETFAHRHIVRAENRKDWLESTTSK